MGALDGRAVVVTGSGKGLGRAYAIHAAGEGARVVVNDIDTDAVAEVVDTITTSGGHAVASHADISSIDGAASVVAACVDTYGSIDGLVNNAAIMYEAPLWEADLSRYQRIVDVNILGTVYCTAAAVKVMKPAGAGAIVNAGSLAALGYPFNGIYASTKGAVTSFSYSAALELTGLGLRINTIWPSAVTPMVIAMMAESTRPETVGQDKLMATPDQIAPLVTYLLSDLSAGVTGQTFHFNGKTLGIAFPTPLASTPHATVEAGWDLASIAEVLNEGALKDMLQPFGPRANAWPPRVADWSMPTAR
jgi:NAD(P)-dependent dehydrogenase (short-subunit alcohol dehydrogenase family)